MTPRTDGEPRTDSPQTPRTAAGKRLLERITAIAHFETRLRGMLHAKDILAIEAEAAMQSSPADLRAALVEPDAHPFRWMLDGTPCWCISADEPHDGWVHAPACQTLLRDRLAVALAASPRPMTSRDATESGTDDGTSPGLQCGAVHDMAGRCTRDMAHPGAHVARSSTPGIGSGGWRNSRPGQPDNTYVEKRRSNKNLRGVLGGVLAKLGYQADGETDVS